MAFFGKTRQEITRAMLDNLAPLSRQFSDDRFYLTGSKPIIADFVLFHHIEYAVHLSD